MNSWYSPSDAIAVIEAFLAAKSWKESTFCARGGFRTPRPGRPGWIEQLRKGNARADDIVRAVNYCAERWPDGADWPPFVVKPRGEKEHGIPVNTSADEAR